MTVGPPPPMPRRTVSQRLLVLALGALRAVTPKDEHLAVLNGVPPANDGTLAMIPALQRRRVRCALLTDQAADADAVASQLGGAKDVMIRRRRTLRGAWLVARAKYVFFTHELWALPPGGRQIMVNLWHGEFTKLLGYWSSARGVESTYATATSRLGVAFRSAEFGISPQRVLVVGSPRNDRMLELDQASAREQLELPTDKRVLLWLPTYRMWPDRRSGPPAPTTADLTALDPWLAARDLLLVIKAHPMAPEPIEWTDTANIRVIPNDAANGPATVTTLLAACDGLITDFSSVWCDFLLLDRPIWIHCPDYRILAEQGHMLLLPVDRWQPGPLSTSIEELTAAVEQVLDSDGRDWRERRDWLLDVLHTHKTGSSAERLLDALGLPLES
ncbi:MAG TPA: CDP-glycerol glycerophosphotransferase family protein [Mycobacteriales bacterium]|nr:CDP-glycerol glycerophosphotransferase family protein [Mycobacteriales bacterium]